MREPVSIASALSLVLTTGVAMVAIFVPGLGQAAQIAIVAFGNAVIILGAAIYARSQTTPTSAPVLDQGTTVTVTTPTGEADRDLTLSPSLVEGYGRDVFVKDA